MGKAQLLNHSIHTGCCICGWPHHQHSQSILLRWLQLTNQQVNTPPIFIRTGRTGYQVCLFAHSRYPWWCPVAIPRKLPRLKHLLLLWSHTFHKFPSFSIVWGGVPWCCSKIDIFTPCTQGSSDCSVSTSVCSWSQCGHKTAQFEWIRNACNLFFQWVSHLNENIITYTYTQTSRMESYEKQAF